MSGSAKSVTIVSPAMRQKLINSYFAGVGEDRKNWENDCEMLQQAAVLAYVAGVNNFEAFVDRWHAKGMDEKTDLVRAFNAIRAAAVSLGIEIEGDTAVLNFRRPVITAAMAWRIRQRGLPLPTTAEYTSPQLKHLASRLEHALAEVRAVDEAVAKIYAGERNAKSQTEETHVRETHKEEDRPQQPGQA